MKLITYFILRPIRQCDFNFFHIFYTNRLINIFRVNTLLTWLLLKCIFRKNFFPTFKIPLFRHPFPWQPSVRMLLITVLLTVRCVPVTSQLVYHLPYYLKQISLLPLTLMFRLYEREVILVKVYFPLVSENA